MPDTKELTGRALDAAVAERVMGWKLAATSSAHDPQVYWSDVRGPNSGMVRSVASYSSDDNAARLVRNRIAELGLIPLFIAELPTPKKTGVGTNHYYFGMMQSTAEQQCRAALAAVEQRAGSAGGSTGRSSSFVPCTS